jgi:hypothetical protein
MTTELSTNFALLEELDPRAAARLLPGVRLMVSKRTFAQIAAEKYAEMKAREVAASPAAPIDAAQADLVRAAAMAAQVQAE